MPMNDKNYFTPVAVIIAGALIAGAVYYSGRAPKPAPKVTLPQELQIGAITPTDHIRGSRDAAITVVEFSDLECPYCQAFQGTMKDLMAEYGGKGQLAWIFRHFTVHSLAPHEAQLAECAWDAKGDDGFWAFVDSVFATSRTANDTTEAELGAMAKAAGFDLKSLNGCAATGKFKAKVSLETKEAGTAGGRGTPFSVIVLKKPLTDAQMAFVNDTNQSILETQPAGTPDVLYPSKDGMRIALGGAFPKEIMESIIQELLK